MFYEIKACMRVLIISKAKALCYPTEKLSHADACYYLSDDYLSLVKIRNRHKPNKILTLEKEFHQTIIDIEKDFLIFSHEINVLNQSDHYWGTHLASRNSGTVPLLRNITYFQCALRKLSQNLSFVVFICQSSGLCHVLNKTISNMGIDCRVKMSIRDRVKSISLYIKILLAYAYFSIFLFSQIIYARILGNERIKEHSEKQRYLIRSWMTNGNLDENGCYQDRNFGGLPEYLSQNGKEIWILPMFFNLGRNIFSQMKLMSKSKVNFLIPGQYLSFLDVLKFIIFSAKSIHLKFKKVHFKGVEFGPVIKEAHLETCIFPSLLELNTVTPLINKLSSKGVHIDRFLFPMENNAPEKPFILAARKYYPKAKIWGFQHTVFFKEQLGVKMCPAEREYYPMPDKVICSGNRYLDIMRQCGFPSKILQLGPNLRFMNDVSSLSWERPSSKNGRYLVLIILNYDDNQNYELLEKCRVVLHQLKNIRILLKPHPVNLISEIKTYLDTIEFPSYQLVGGTVKEWLLQSHAVIMAGGSISNIETIATGVPLIRISLDNNFDFDCLWDEYPFSPFVSSPKQIKECLEKAFQLSAKEQMQLQEFTTTVIDGYFEPITSKHLESFL